MIQRLTAADRTSALGRAGRVLETALLALETYEAIGAGDRRGCAVHAALVQVAADSLWQFLVQREACGLTDHRSVDEHFSIPSIVWKRIGVRPSPTDEVRMS